MAHEISNVSGQDEVFTVGEKPWHGLGANVQEAVTSKEAMDLAGLDWEVRQAPCYGQLDNAFRVPNRVVNYRVDPDGNPVALGVVGDGYVPLQNREAFAFMDKLVGEGLAIYHTAGAIKQGRRVWIAAKLPQDTIVGDKDRIENYLLLANGHDGGLSVRAFWTPIRVVCNNTLSMALGRAAQGFAVRHSGKLEERIEDARKVLGIVTQKADDLGRIFNRLMASKISDADVKSYFERVVPKNEEAERQTRRDNVLESMETNYRGGRGSALAVGTAWGAYNAVTEWVDHSRYESRKRQNPEARFESSVFGQGQAIKVRAFDLAAEIVGIK